jgi:hypothetical protein
MSCMHPRAYIDRHKLDGAPTGWTKQGPLALRRVMEELIPMIIEEVSDNNDDDDDVGDTDEEYVISN